jgi:RHS repeat-associated protein
MVCAYKTSDGQQTSFHYSTSGNLARIVQPGSATSDFGYDSFGRITQTRDALANDAIAASVRANDATATTELTYDSIGRVASITLPAATASATRMQHTYEYYIGESRVRVTGATEPNSFSRKVTYDAFYRTLGDTDIANLTATTEWDAAKDLVLSKTDAVGLKTTTLYDYNDRPTHSYGPAPTAWFDTNRAPLSTYSSQVPHTESKYDESIAGLGAAFYNYGSATKTLAGAPKLHTTGIGGTGGVVQKTWSSTLPITPDSGYNWGARLTGEIKLNVTGNYYFRPYSDDGVRLYIDDQLVVDDWNDGSPRWHNVGTYNNTTAGSYHRIRLDYYDRSNGDARLELYLSTSASGGGETLVAGSSMDPRYGLGTSSTTYDATLGNTMAATSYGSNPELGLAQSSTVDPSGLNLATASTYETQGATGSFLRQLTKALPGGATTNYTYYGATETRDDPCTTGTEAHKQAGMLKIKTDPDPDGAGSQTGRATETIYDDAGRIVATRYNSENWTCTSYDSRGRVAQIHVQAYNGNSDRTVSNNYAVSGNPLQTATYDEQGWVITTVDLLGRTKDYTDTWGDWTGYEYDGRGNLTRKYGDMGEEIFTYDNYNRQTTHVFDGTTYATVSYDAYGRIDHVDYNNASQLRLTMGYDTLGRVNGETYRKGDGTSGPIDSVTRATTGDIVSGTENGTSKSYTYDLAGRLTAATIGSNTYSYGFGTESSSCNSLTGNNTNAGKDGNRTTQTINGTTTYFCYDQADRLIGSGNALYNTPTYDSRGNMTTLGTGTTPLNMGYDSSDRNSYFTQLTSAGTGTATYYNRDVQSRITYREKDTIATWNWTLAGQWFYSFTGSGDTPDFVRDANWTVTEKYLSLPGGVLMTVRPAQTGNAQKTYSLQNIHGDSFATTNAAGAVLTTTLTGPFGEPISGQTNPNNTVTDSTFSYVGKHEKITETAFALTPIEMGARVYIPVLGRFTSMDPVEGGTPNSYVYVLDPVNEFDLTGEFTFTTKWKIGIGIGIGVGVVAAACYFTAGAGCVSVAARGVSAAVGYAKTVKVSIKIHPPHHSWENPFSGKQWYKHVELRFYRTGIKGSDKRVQIPYGKGYDKKYGK